jgi:hypothetical protein
MMPSFPDSLNKARIHFPTEEASPRSLNRGYVGTNDPMVTESFKLSCSRLYNDSETRSISLVNCSTNHQIDNFTPLHGKSSLLCPPSLCKMAELLALVFLRDFPTSPRHPNMVNKLSSCFAITAR